MLRSLVMDPIKKSIDDSDRAQISQARAMTPEERLLAGCRLFEYACTMTKEGIRADNPALSENQVLDVLRQRLALRRRLEQRS